MLSRPRSRPDPFGGSEPKSGARYYLYYLLGLSLTCSFSELYLYLLVHKTILVITKIICTYTKELPPEWCPSQFIHIYRVPFTYTFKIFYYKNIRDCGSSAGEHLYLSRPTLLIWNVLSSILVFSFCTYTD